MSEIFTPDKLFAGHVMPLVTEKGVVASGAGSVVRGTVMGRITASGKLVPVDSGSVDGSEVPYGIICDTVDATAADVPCALYMTGEFNEAALTFGGTDDADTHRVALRGLGIFLKPTISA